MANRTTKRERQVWQGEAERLVKLDDRGKAANFLEVVQHIVRKYGCSEGSARTATGNAALVVLGRRVAARRQAEQEAVRAARERGHG